jgi:hypothetical protein
MEAHACMACTISTACLRVSRRAESAATRLMRAVPVLHASPCAERFRAAVRDASGPRAPHGGHACTRAAHLARLISDPMQHCATDMPTISSDRGAAKSDSSSCPAMCVPTTMPGARAAVTMAAGWLVPLRSGSAPLPRMVSAPASFCPWYRGTAAKWVTPDLLCKCAQSTGSVDVWPGLTFARTTASFEENIRCRECCWSVPSSDSASSSPCETAMQVPGGSKRCCGPRRASTTKQSRVAERTDSLQDGQQDR